MALGEEGGGIISCPVASVAFSWQVSRWAGEQVGRKKQLLQNRPYTTDASGLDITQSCAETGWDLETLVNLA